MKMVLRILGVSVLALCIAACDDGKDGAAGTNGTNGSNGSNGTDGTNGTDGSDGAGQIIALQRIGRSTPQGFNVGAAEIVDYDHTNKEIFTINAQNGGVDVYDASNVSTLAAATQTLNLKQMLVDNAIVANTTLVGGVNSIAVFGNKVAVAVEANPKTNTGWVVILSATDLSFLHSVAVGALPDMLRFTPNGSKIVVANEGEPDVGYVNDPVGSISVIDATTYAVTTIDFSAFNSGGARNAELPVNKMVLSGYNASVAQDIEPEYIAVSDDNQRAYVSLQENNAMAVVDLNSNSVEKIIGLGFKNHSIPGNEMDASQQDGVNLKTWPVYGMYMPDTLHTFAYNGKTYIVTANEGDSREDWLNGITDSVACLAGAYYFKSKCRDELALRDLADSDLVLGTALSGLTTDNTLGRLKFSYRVTKQRNGGTTINSVYAYGGRSFAIWDASSGEQVFDSGNAFERITAQRYDTLFNQDHNGSLAGDKRSNSKGPEPEALALGKIAGHTYAFIGLERMGGIMVFDISNPFAPAFVQYVNDRDVTKSPDITNAASGMDLGPEGFKFVSAENSPTQQPLLIVGNEVSGNTSVYGITVTALQD